MFKFVSGSTIKEKIQAILKPGLPASLAVAYWGKGASTLLGLPDKLDHVTILCDLRSGFCNPKEMIELLNRGAKIRTRNGLHAKVYLSGGQVVIGSANASANGLGGEGGQVDLALEAGTFTDDRGIIRDSEEWFAIQLNGADVVDKALIEQCKPIWLAKQRAKLDGKTFLAVLEKEPEALSKQSIRLLVYESEEPTKSQMIMYEKLGPKLFGPMFKKYAEDNEYPFYVDETGTWKVSAGDFFIDYTIDPETKKLDFNGIWQAFPNTPDWQVPIRPGSKGKITFLREYHNSIGELAFNPKDQNILKRRIKEYLKQKPLELHLDHTVDVPVHTAKWLRAS